MLKGSSDGVPYRTVLYCTMIVTN